MYESDGRIKMNSQAEMVSFIKRNVDIFFRAEMQMSDRLIESFQFAMKDFDGIAPVGFWLVAIKQYPQLIDFLDSVGFRFDDVNWKKWPTMQMDMKYLNWYVSLNTIFNKGYNDEEPEKIYGEVCNSLYDRAKKQRRVDIIDCLAATLSEKAIMNSAIQFLYSGINAGKEFPNERFGSPKDWLWTKGIVDNLLKWRLANQLIEDQSFVIYRAGNKIKLMPYVQLSLSKIYYLPEHKIDSWLSRGNVVERPGSSFEIALQYLEDLINSGAKESAFQTFFENHPHFLLLLGNYKDLYPQLVLRQDDGSSLIPDFFLERIDSGYCDLLDLKRPVVNVVRYQKNRLRFRDCVMEAIAQLNEYRNWFDDKDNRSRFQAKYGLNVMKPQAVILIGRQRDYKLEVDTLKLESNLPNWVQLRTYDSLLDRAKQWKQFVDNYRQ